MKTNRNVFRVALASEDVEPFLAQCSASQWYAVDTGERVMTEEGPDAEAILLVGPLERTTARHAVPVVH